MDYFLVALGVLGAAIDILLHFLQLLGREVASPKATARLTLLGCILMAVSLCHDFNLGAMLMQVFIAGMAIYAISTGKEMP